MEKRFDDTAYILYESSHTRLERVIQRLVIVTALSTSLLFLSNALWLWALTGKESELKEEYE